MNPLLETMTGTADMTDQVIAMDLLISAKTGVRNYAYALTEVATDEIRTVLRRHLDAAIATHEQITNYMMEQDWYNAYDVSKQLQLDVQNAQTALGTQ